MKQVKTIIVFATMMLMLTNMVLSQQISRRSQFMINSFMINPAVAGTLKYSPLYISYRNQWAGFKSGPTTMMASGHTSLPKNFGLGAQFYLDDTGGAISETGVELAGAYHVELNRKEDAISFGLSANVAQYKFDNSKLVVYDPNDLALNGGMAESHLNIDATFGMMVYGKNYYAGFSIPQLVQTKLKLETEVSKGENKNVRHYHFMGSYRYILNDTWDLQPSLLLKFTGSTPVQMDLNIRTNYMSKLYAGMTYRPKDAVSVLLGALYNNFAFSYSYDITTSAARALSPHSHEIMIGYHLIKKTKYRTRSRASYRIIN